METPFGPFEPSVELVESQAKTLLRSLEFFETVRTGTNRPTRRCSHWILLRSSFAMIADSTEQKQLPYCPPNFGQDR